MTIVEAIKKAMLEAGRPLSAREAYDIIVAKKMYQFQAQDPRHVVAMQIRRHTVGLDFPTAAPTKHFKVYGDNTYLALDKPVRISPTPTGGAKKLRARKKTASKPKASEHDPTRLAKIETVLWDTYRRYLAAFKQQMLRELKKMTPQAFEEFGRDLLAHYGFEDTEVTRVYKDGGIDGYGRLKVGLAHLNVSFQCKRWTNKTIQRPEIDRFRGASQGPYQQGIFFTTSKFSPGAIAASIQLGSIPIVMIDGLAIVDMMIEKKIRIESTPMDVPALAV